MILISIVISLYRATGMGNNVKREQEGIQLIFILSVIYTRYFEIRRFEFDASALRFKRRGSLAGPVKPVYNSKAEFIDWRDR